MLRLIALLCTAVWLGGMLPAAAETAADRFAPKRGFSTDIWVQWMNTHDLVTTPGFLDIYPDYPRTLPAGAFAKLRAQGFDTVRIAADPSPLLALAGTAREAGLLTNLRQRVLEAQAAGLKVVLDLHTYPHAGDVGDIDGILASTAKFAAYLRMVAKVAAKIADLNPDITAFEVMNEPTQDCDAIHSDPTKSDWPAKLKRLHDTARNAAPKLPLVLSGACWGGSKGLSVLDPAPLADDNVLWSFHTYDPFIFTHQGASWTNSIQMFLMGLPFPPSRVTDAIQGKAVTAARVRAAASTNPLAAQATRPALRQMVMDYRQGPSDAISASITEATTWADARGIPHSRLFLGEFGALWVDDAGSRMDPGSHNRFLSAKRLAAEAAGVGWAVWSFSGNFGITDQKARLYPGVCIALGMDKC